MRLIDADKLKEKKEYSKARHEYVVSVAQIDWQPTIQPQGIDKDRLIYELTKLKNELNSVNLSPSVSLDYVIKIINEFR